MHYLSCFSLTVIIALFAIFDRLVMEKEAPYLCMSMAIVFAIRNTYRANFSGKSSSDGKGFHPHGNADATFVLTMVVLLLGVSLGLTSALNSDSSLSGIELYSWLMAPIVIYSLIYGILMDFFLENKNRVCERAMDLERLISLITTITIGICSFASYGQDSDVFSPIMIVVSITAFIRLVVTMLFREISVAIEGKNDRSNLW